MMITRRSCLVPAVVAVAMLCAGAALATVTLGFGEDWNDGLSPWTNAAPIGSDATTLTIGNDGDNYFSISFGAQSAPPAGVSERIYTQDGSYTGDYSGIPLQFAWWEEYNASTYVFFRGAGSTRIWELVFDNATTNQWQTHGVLFQWSEGWTLYGGGAGETIANFMNDLGDVDAIGIAITSYATTEAQDYRLDDWEYTIPEPGALCMLGAAVISFGAAFGRRVRFLVPSPKDRRART